MCDAGPEPRAVRGALPAPLLVWFSPAFPTGAFAYSQGLEALVANGQVRDGADLAEWLRASLEHGPLGIDARVLSLTMRADARTLRAIAELSAAMQPSSERASEALMLGATFRQAVCHGWPEVAPAFAKLADIAPTIAVAVGIAAAGLGLPPADISSAYLNSHVTNLLSAAIRLSILGQFEALRVHRELETTIDSLSVAAQSAELSDLGTSIFASDLASIQHETQTVRLFRS